MLFVKKDNLIKKFILEFNKRNYSEAIKIANRLIKKRVEKKLKAFLLTRLGTLYEDIGKIEEAVEVFNQVLKEFEDSKDFNLYKAQVLRELSYISYYAGDYSKAIDYLQDSNKYFEKMSAQKKNTAKNMLNIAMYLIDSGQITRAKQVVENLSSQTLNFYSVDIYARSLNLLGVIKLYEESDTKKAMELFNRALRSLDLENDEEKYLGLKAMILFNLGWVNKEEGNIEKALDILKKIKDIEIEDDELKIYVDLLEAELKVDQGNIKEAEKILLEMPNRLTKKQNFKFLVEVFAFLAELKIEEKDFELAFDMLNASMEFLDKVAPLEKALVYTTFGRLKLEQKEHFEALKHNFEAVKMIQESGFSFTPLKMKKVLSRALKALSQTIETILTEIQKKDLYTLGHSVRVAFYALKVSEMLYLPSDKKFEITVGALLHDIGKINIPTEILTKPGKLTDDEFEIIKKHPVYGSEIAERLGLPETIKNVIKYHHQKYDGKNSYPDNIKGDQIPIEAQITALCDIFDAMTSNRPYRDALSFETVLKYFKESGKNISKEFILDTFIEFLTKNTDLINRAMENFEELWKNLISEIFENANLKEWSIDIE
jgi:putative nucleotidyltransferase with HDIG domain